MSSIIEGYSYDIFISYRQKDNKGDRWVSEFVEALKTELESTFKEEISVYFDINPHDGLLETHDVDASLKDKLKCLVFIPIISRTYCDPKSFAWEHEFKAFVEQASQDQFGLKVKLPGGNVANRVLPVQIHELDAEDKRLVENELGGHLRGIEFIYKEPGVNRPLRANEDHPDNNLNKTFYRNQINKVANAIKEVISAIKLHGSKQEEELQEAAKPMSAPRKNHKTTIIAGLIIALVLTILGFLFIPKLFKASEVLEKSIAVLPFKNYSGDPEQEYMSDGLTDEIINHLYKIKSFDRVVSLSSVMTYKGTDKKVPRIAYELGVNYILEGTYKKIGDKVRVTAQLIEPKNDRHIWQQEYDQPYREIIAIQADIALKIADQIKVFLTENERQDIQKIPTTNQEAYNLIQRIIVDFMKGATTADRLKQDKDSALKAIGLDPNYVEAYAWAGALSLFEGTYSGNKEITEAVVNALPFIQKALDLDQNDPFAHAVMGSINVWVLWDYVKAENEFLKVAELVPNDGSIFLSLGELYLKMNQLEDARHYITKYNDYVNVTKELVGMFIHPATLIVKLSVLSGNEQEAYDCIDSNFGTQKKKPYVWLGEYYIWLRDYDSAKVSLENALRDKDPYISLPRFQACLALAFNKTKDYQKARTIINQLIIKSDTTSVGSPDFYTGWYYSGIGEADSAIYWLEKAYKSRSAEMSWLKSDPVFKNLKGDKRYWDLYEQTGHKAYDDYLVSKKNN